MIRTALLHLLLPAGVLISVASCRTAPSGIATSALMTDKVRTDTVRIVAVRADTVRLRDSIHVRELVRGDTVRIETHHYHYIYRTRAVRDTLRQIVRDTVRRDSTSTHISTLPPATAAPAWRTWLRVPAIVLTLALLAYCVAPNLLKRK